MKRIYILGLSSFLILIFFSCKKISDAVYYYSIPAKSVSLKVEMDSKYEKAEKFILTNSLTKTNNFKNDSFLIINHLLNYPQIDSIYIDSVYLEVPANSNIDLRTFDTIRVYLKDFDSKVFEKICYVNNLKNLPAGQNRLYLEKQTGLKKLLFLTDYFEIYLDGNTRSFVSKTSDINLIMSFKAKVRPYYKNN